ncbi:MAG: phage portal protein, partial [Actinomycetota bacterium]
KARKLILTDLWNDWCKTSDADGVLNFSAQQTLAVRAWFESGEVFIRFRPRPEESGLPVPLQIQLIEAWYRLTTDPLGVVGDEIICGYDKDSNRLWSWSPRMMSPRYGSSAGWPTANRCRRSAHRLSPGSHRWTR